MKIYVAGAWVEQHQRARPMIAAVRAAGLEVTCDWTQAEGDICACGQHRQEHRDLKFCPDGSTFNGVGSGGDSKLTANERHRYALADLAGVFEAEIVWLLAANDKGACGSWVELGAALAGKRWSKELVKDGIRMTWNGIDQPAPIIVVSGEKWQRTIFTELADRKFESDSEALAFIVKMHETKRRDMLERFHASLLGIYGR